MSKRFFSKKGEGLGISLKAIIIIIISLVFFFVIFAAWTAIKKGIFH